MSFFNADTLVSGTDGLLLKDLGTTATTPNSGYGSLYVNSDALYFVNDTGSTTNISNGGGGTITALNNQAENRLVTIGATTTELDGEATLTFSSNILEVPGKIKTKSESTANYSTPIINITTGGINNTPTSNKDISFSGDVYIDTPKTYDLNSDATKNKGVRSSNISIFTGTGGSLQSKKLSYISLLGKTGYINGESVSFTSISGSGTGAIGRVITKKIYINSNYISRTNSLYDGNEYVTSIEIISGGSGYAAEDVLRIDGNLSGTQTQRVYVISTSSGVISSIGLLYGDYTTSWTSGEDVTDSVNGSTVMHVASITIKNSHNYLSSLSEKEFGTTYSANMNYRNSQVITLTGVSSTATAVAYVSTYNLTPSTYYSNNISSTSILGATGYQSGEYISAITHTSVHGTPTNPSLPSGSITTNTYNGTEYVSWVSISGGTGWYNGDIITITGATSGTVTQRCLISNDSSGGISYVTVLYPNTDQTYTYHWTSPNGLASDNISSDNIHSVNTINNANDGNYYVETLSEYNALYSSYYGYTNQDIVTISDSNTSANAYVYVYTNDAGVYKSDIISTVSLLGATGYQNSEKISAIALTSVNGTPTNPSLPGGTITTLTFGGVSYITSVNLSGGSGWATGDIITITGATSGTATQRCLISNDSSGGISYVTVLYPNIDQTYTYYWTNDGLAYNNISNPTNIHTISLNFSSPHDGNNYISGISEYNSLYSSQSGYTNKGVITISDSNTSANTYAYVSTTNINKLGGNSGDIILSTGEAGNSVNGGNAGSIYITAGNGGTGDLISSGTGGSGGNVNIHSGSNGSGMITGSSGFVKLGVYNTDYQIIGNSINKMEKNIFMKEMASSETSLNGYGQLWVKNNTPNDLHFTNDNYSDIRITNGSYLGGTNIKVPDSGTIGSNTTPTALTIDSSGNLTTLGNLTIGDNISLSTDSSVISFGADSEISLVHVADNGLNIKNSFVSYTDTLYTCPKEDFTASNFDLGNKTITYKPSGSDYYVTKNNSIAFVSISGHTQVTSPTSGSMDDGYQTVNFTNSKSFKFNNVSYTTVYIGTNGYLTFDSGRTSYPTAVDSGWIALWVLGDDLNTGGDDATLHYHQTGDTFIVTYTNVPDFGSTIDNSIQITLYFSSHSTRPNEIDVNYGDIAAASLEEVVIGITDGSSTPTSVDFSTLPSALTPFPSPVKFTLQTAKSSITTNDIIGTVNFQAPDVSSGGDSILVAAGIEAIAETTFSASNNATKLSFKTGSSEEAAEKMSLSSTGTLKLTETSAATADEAGKGQLWVKDSTPNELYFTNDAGNDIQITTQNNNIMPGFQSSIEIQTSNGHTDISGSSSIMIKACGSGGGGGGAGSASSDGDAGGGGGSGEYAEIYLNSSDIGSYTHIYGVISSGGTGGGTSTSNGSNAIATTIRFASSNIDTTGPIIATIAGGGGGYHGNSWGKSGIGGLGGSISTGTGFLLPGRNGDQGIDMGGSTNHIYYTTGGNGGDSHLGRGGMGAQGNASAPTTTGEGFGFYGGGGGGGVVGNGNEYSSSDGSSGVIFIYIY